MIKFFLTISLILNLFAFESYSAVGASGLPLPRFVSLRTNEANVRTGPGMQYPKKWVLVKKNIPLEIISEYEDWRKIRDIQGDEGWIHKAMLSGKRTAMIRNNGTKVFKNDDISSQVKAVLENGVIVKIDHCKKYFCKSQISDIKGYIRPSNVWGVYLEEVFD